MFRAMPFSALALKDNILFDVDIVVKNIKTQKSKYGLSCSVLLSTSTRRYSFPKHFFRIVSVCWAILQKFLRGKSDAYKYLISIMQRVHFQVRVGVFICQQILAKISFVIFDIVIKNKSNVG